MKKVESLKEDPAVDIEQHELIEHLFLEIYEKLLAYARCSLPEDGLAEEAVQETFRIACQRPESLQASSNPKGWLMNTLKNTISNIKHNRATAAKVLASYQPDRGQNAFSEDEICLSALYEDLADTEDFKILREYAIEGRSHYEMAMARGITVDACKKRLQRAKENLRMKILK